MASRQRGGDKPKKSGRNGANHFEEDAPRNSGHGDVGHNSEARLKQLDDKIAAYCVEQQEEDALMERYIKPVRDRKNRIKADAKRDLGTPTKAFNARANLRLIELEDDDEIVLAVNELFKATPVGKNLDLIALGERVEKARAEKAAAKTKAKASEEAVA